MKTRSMFRFFCLGTLCASTLLAAAPMVRAQPSIKATDRPFIPLTSPPTHRILPGKIVFSMLVTPDLANAQSFYGQLFGWTFRPVGDDRTQRVEILLDSRPVGTMVSHAVRRAGQDVPFWMPFLSTSDTATVARTIRKQGGKVLFGPHRIAGLGQTVIVSDPQHGIFGALSSDSGDPVDQPIDPQPGSWAWASLLTPYPMASAGYYQQLFGYRIAAASQQDSTTHFIVTSQDRERASINTLPSGIDQKDKARWIQFVQVGNSATVAERAQALGGHVIVPTHIDRDGAQVAILSDPAGAVFGVIEPQGDVLEGGAVR